MDSYTELLLELLLELGAKDKRYQKVKSQELSGIGLAWAWAQELNLAR